MSEKTGSFPTKNLLIATLALALALSLIYNFRQNSALTEIRTEQKIIQERCDTVAFRKAELEREVAAITEDLNRYKGRSEELDRLLQEANDKIDKQKKEISRLIEQNKDYSVLKARYADLRKLKDRYLAQIDSLMAENKKLRYENTELAVRVDRLKEEKASLSEKVEMAGSLKLRNIRITALQVKASGRIKEVDKASKADRLSIRMTVQENPLAKTGPRTAYVRILSPQGFVMTDVSESARKFKTKEGREIPFSRSVTFEYSGQAVPLEVDYDQEVFSPGTFKVEVYIDGEFAGSEQFTLQ
jgi:hypothetical protein